MNKILVALFAIALVCVSVVTAVVTVTHEKPQRTDLSYRATEKKESIIIGGQTVKDAVVHTNAWVNPKNGQSQGYITVQGKNDNGKVVRYSYDWKKPTQVTDGVDVLVRTEGRIRNQNIEKTEEALIVFNKQNEKVSVSSTDFTINYVVTESNTNVKEVKKPVVNKTDLKTDLKLDFVVDEKKFDESKFVNKNEFDAFKNWAIIGFVIIVILCVFNSFLISRSNKKR